MFECMDKAICSKGGYTSVVVSDDGCLLYYLAMSAGVGGSVSFDWSCYDPTDDQADPVRGEQVYHSCSGSLEIERYEFGRQVEYLVRPAPKK